MNKKVCIKVNSITEKMAAVFLLSQAYDIKPATDYQDSLLPGFWWVKPDYSNAIINASATEPSYQHYHVIDFSPDLTPEKIRKMLEVKVIRLNNEYSAEVSKGKVKVGCQTFPIEKIQEILDAHSKLS